MESTFGCSYYEFVRPVAPEASGVYLGSGLEVKCAIGMEVLGIIHCINNMINLRELINIAKFLAFNFEFQKTVLVIDTNDYLLASGFNRS